MQCKDKWIYKGCLLKPGIFIKLKGFLVEFLENNWRTGDPEKIKAARKSPEKWTFLSLAFYNAPSLDTIEGMLKAKNMHCA